jgi:hypothetical protein
MCTCRFAGKLFEANPVFVRADRQKAPPEVTAEEARQKNAEMIKEATALADDGKIGKAQVKIDDAHKELEDVLEQKLNSKNSLIETQIAELQEHKKLMESLDIYDMLGRAFGYALLSSHERQRPSAKGDDIGKFLLYATPVAEKLLEQAKKYDEKPSEPPPSADEDQEEVNAADPLAEISGALTAQLETVIQAFQSIIKIINKD